MIDNLMRDSGWLLSVQKVPKTLVHAEARRRGVPQGCLGGATVPREYFVVMTCWCAPNPERLRTRRYDAGGTLRMFAGPTGLVNLRGSVSSRRHGHTFGSVLERDVHATWFGEAAYTLTRGVQTRVVGAAMLGESYDGQDVDGFDFSFTTPGVFTQVTMDASSVLTFTGSARVD